MTGEEPRLVARFTGLLHGRLSPASQIAPSEAGARVQYGAKAVLHVQLAALEVSTTPARKEGVTGEKGILTS